MFNIRIKLFINFDRIQISPAGIPYKDGPPSPPNLVTPHAHQKNRKKRMGFLTVCIACIDLSWSDRGKKVAKKKKTKPSL